MFDEFFEELLLQSVFSYFFGVIEYFCFVLESPLSQIHSEVRHLRFASKELCLGKELGRQWGASLVLMDSLLTLDKRLKP